VSRIPDQFADCCVYLYPSVDHAERGEKIGGSGFLAAIRSDSFPDVFHIYAVTNMHVIESGNTVVRLNTKDGKTDIFDLDERSWVFHPNGDDLAITDAVRYTDLHKYRFLGADDHFITQEFIDEYNIGVGDETFVVGRFINQEGKQQNIPTVRFGNIAQMPPETIPQPRGLGKFEQESFIVEAKSISGYSGAPVFVGIDPLYARPDRPNITALKGRSILLGVSWGYISDWDPVFDASGNPVPSGMRVRSNTGMMAVVPAWKLRELFDMSAVKDRRAQRDAQIAAERAAFPAVPTATPSSPPANDENPTHREDFERLLGKAAKPQKTD
jgi:hypothetical protein